MTDRQALLASVLARPADDEPRMVYADWLDEHGERERAEFIRLQCELARLPEPPVPVRVGLGSHLREDLAMALVGEVSKFLPADPHKAERDRLTARERELLDAHGRDWIGREVPVGFSDDAHREFYIRPPQVVLACGWHNEANEYYNFARGFVESVICPAAGWLAHHAALAWHPEHREDPCPETAQPVTHVRLTTRPVVAPEWITTPGEDGRALVSYTIATDQQMETFEFVADSRLGTLTADAVLKHVWPWLTVELPPEPREGRGATVQIGGHVMMAPEWWFEPQDLELPVDPEVVATLRRFVGAAQRAGEAIAAAMRPVVEAAAVDSADESPSAAPPDHARRRPGNSRMPDWLAEQRRRRR